MIDNIQIRTQFSDQDFKKMVAKLSLNVPINSDKVKFDWENLRFTYYPNISKLIVTNSLHKFYNLVYNETVKSAINHNDFTIQNFYTVVDFLAEYLFEKSFQELFISSRFEFGLNIDTENYKPFDIISKYQSISSTHINEFYTVAPKQGKPIQRNCNFSDYYYKGYCKSTQANIVNANILRFEIVVTELRKLRHILKVEDITIADLVKLENWCNMFNFLIDTYDSIRKIPDIKNQSLSLEEINAIYSYCNKMKRSDIQKSTTRYYFEQLNKNFKTIYEKLNESENNYHNIVKVKMIQTFNRLIGAKSVEFQHV